MENIPVSILRRPAWLLAFWTIFLYFGFILSIFLHEDGHGFGARLDGVHVSTGFNKVGDYGKSPDQPDFRSESRQGAFWAGLLGPVTTWLLAGKFTFWLYRFKQSSWGALSVGALAVANGLIRTLPMILVLTSFLRGEPYLEDEVGWGVWFVLKYFRPDLAADPSSFHLLLKNYPKVFLDYPAIWFPPIFSLSISLGFLIPAYKRNFFLWRGVLLNMHDRLLFGLSPMAAYILMEPVLRWLDRLIRINW